MTTLSFSTPRRSLVVPIAPAGSGKSTLLSQVAAALGEPGFRFGADDVRKLMYGSVRNLGPGGPVHFAAQAMVGARLANGRPAAYDSTSTTPWERKNLLELAARHQATPVALLASLDANEIHRRNASRDAVAQVPDFVVNDMIANMAGLTPDQLLAEGFSAVYVFDASTTELAIEFTDESSSTEPPTT